jgi:hypothetical protein
MTRQSRWLGRATLVLGTVLLVGLLVAGCSLLTDLKNVDQSVDQSKDRLKPLDNVTNNVTGTPPTATITAGGSVTVNYKIVATGGDGQPGCNAADGTPATVTPNVPSGVTKSPDSLTFTACGVNQPVVFSSSTPGTYTITVSVSDTGPGSYNTAPATFTLQVNPPPDSTPPVVNVSFPPPDGLNGWFVTSPVTGTVTADDTTTGGSNITAINCIGATVGPVIGLGTPSASAPLTVSGDDIHSISCTATDSAGNSGAGPGSNNTATVKIDTTPPTVTCDPPPTYFLNQTGATVSATVTDATSGPAVSPVIVSVSTAAVGSQSAPVTGTDVAGNSTTVSCSYSVIYNFIGFLQPVDNPPTFNVAKAGRTIPVKWQLQDGNGVFISDLSVVVNNPLRYRQINCDATSPSDPLPADTSGSSGLRYDSTTNQYIFTWQTSSAFAGKCYELLLDLNDGTQKTARFKFTK